VPTAEGALLPIHVLGFTAGLDNMRYGDRSRTVVPAARLRAGTPGKRRGRKTRLEPDQVKAIIKMRRDGYTLTQIASP
jgi:hypothetical protein